MANNDKAPLYLNDEEGNRYIPEPFTYSIRFDGLTGLWNQVSGQIQIQADAAFVILEQTYSFVESALPTSDLTTALTPNVDVMLTNTGSGRRLMNQPVALESLFGSGKLPFVLPTPQFFSPSSALQVQVTSGANFGGDVYTLQISFIGEKRYYLN
jgi:hypothetical protein